MGIKLKKTEIKKAKAIPIIARIVHATKKLILKIKSNFLIVISKKPDIISLLMKNVKFKDD